MDLKDLYRDVIVDHNRNPRNFRAMPDADRHADGLQPAVRRHADGVREARRRPHQRRLVRRQRLRDLGRVGLAADRERQGQDASPEAEAAVRARCTTLLTRDDADVRRGEPRQARRAVRRARVPGAREVREPLLAHARCGAAPAGRAGQDRVTDTGVTAVYRADNEPVTFTRDVRRRHRARRHQREAARRASRATSPRRSAAASPSTSRATCSASRARTPTRSARKPVERAGAAARTRATTTCASSPGSR